MSALHAVAPRRTINLREWIGGDRDRRVAGALSGLLGSGHEPRFAAPGHDPGLVLVDRVARLPAVGVPAGPEVATDLRAVLRAALYVFTATALDVCSADIRGVDLSALFAPSPPASRDELLGYRRGGDGWIAVAAVGRQQIELVAQVLDAAPAADTAARLVGRLQSLGVAALPAPRLRPAGPPAHGGRAALPDRPIDARVIELAPSGRAPLEGVRVLDLGQLVAGPFAARMLAELGADVVRLRPPGRADVHPEAVCDARTEAGRRRLAGELRRADLVIENFSWRGWEQLTRRLGVRPVRHVAVRGFPAVSPCRNWKVLGFLAEAAVGLGDPPAIHGDWAPAPRVPALDRAAGLIAAAAAVRLLAAPGAELHVSLVQLGGAAARELRRRPST